LSTSTVSVAPAMSSRLPMSAAASEHDDALADSTALNGVPLDVLAERLNTTRGALYKTLHDARRQLRADLPNRGFTLDSI
jgi:RNA polymerase sigma-70 factor, ECF subfamily